MNKFFLEKTSQHQSHVQIFTDGSKVYLKVAAAAVSSVAPSSPPQWGAADAEIKVPSSENTELKRSAFKAWSRSVYSHTCYAYCQGFLPCLFLPLRSIHLHFFQNLSRFLLCWLWLTLGSCVGPQNRWVTLPDAGSRVQCSRNINRLRKKT